jgi:hypothetical protein
MVQEIYHPTAILAYNVCDQGDASTEGNPEFVEMFVSLLQSGDTVMDIGCGSSLEKSIEISKQCKARGINVKIIAVDPVKLNLQLYKNHVLDHHGITYQRGEYSNFLDLANTPPKYRVAAKQIVEDAVSLEARVIAVSFCGHILEDENLMAYTEAKLKDYDQHWLEEGKIIAAKGRQPTKRQVKGIVKETFESEDEKAIKAWMAQTGMPRELVEYQYWKGQLNY